MRMAATTFNARSEWAKIAKRTTVLKMFLKIGLLNVQRKLSLVANSVSCTASRSLYRQNWKM